MWASVAHKDKQRENEGYNGQTAGKQASRHHNEQTKWVLAPSVFPLVLHTIKNTTTGTPAIRH